MALLLAVLPNNPLQDNQAHLVVSDQPVQHLVVRPVVLEVLLAVVEPQLAAHFPPGDETC